MSFKIQKESFESVSGYFADRAKGLNWPSIFVLPLWMQAWWKIFGGDYEPLLLSAFKDQDLIGIAPLMRRGPEAFIVGSADVCDYLDFITIPGRESDFFSALLPALKKEGIERLELSAQRPDAAVFSGIFAAREQLSVEAGFSRENESFEINPGTSWEDYLAGLKKKQRHEVRRKLRRLGNKGGSYNYRVIDKAEEIKEFVPLFLELFQHNPDKAGFLTERMEQFFRELIEVASGAGLARFGLLEIEEEPAAVVLYFDYEGRIYLYNSGFSSRYSDLSPGLISKILCIRDSIEKGRRVFDFLKGREVYKSRLGGISIPIYKTRITIT